MKIDKWFLNNIDVCELRKRDKEGFLLVIRIYYDDSKMCYCVKWKGKFDESEAETDTMFFSDYDKNVKKIDGFGKMLRYIEENTHKRFELVKNHINKRLNKLQN